MYHATNNSKMRADELMQKMWDKDVVGIADQNKRLTAEAVSYTHLTLPTNREV